MKVLVATLQFCFGLIAAPRRALLALSLLALFRAVAVGLLDLRSCLAKTTTIKKVSAEVRQRLLVAAAVAAGLLDLRGCLAKTRTIKEQAQR